MHTSDKTKQHNWLRGPFVYDADLKWKVQSLENHSQMKPADMQVKANMTMAMNSR